jgi:hypothetical protein
MKAHYTKLSMMFLILNTQSPESLQIIGVPTLCEPCSACTLRSLVHAAPALYSQTRTLCWLSCRSMNVQLLRIISQSAHVSSQEA